MTTSWIRRRAIVVATLLLASGCAIDSAALEEVGDSLIGGRIVQPGEFPATVFIATDQSACTGAVVGRDMILTAAHCVDGPGEVPGAGLWVSNAPVTRYSTLVADGAIRLTIAAIHIHPTYAAQCTNGTACGPVTAAPDVAVIRLSTALPNSFGTAVVDSRRLLPNERVILMGYGCEAGYNLTETEAERDQLNLRLAHTRIGYPIDTDRLSPPIGRLDARSVSRSYDFPVGLALEAGTAGLCPGDSGGPLFLDDGGRNRVVGVNAYIVYVGSASNTQAINATTRLDEGSLGGVAGWLRSLGVPVVDPTPEEILGSAGVFDSAYYAAHNPDLAGAGIVGADALRRHWSTAGAREGRVGHPVFRADQYFTLNEDLRSAFGGRADLAAAHFVRSGYDEARTPSLIFHPAVYDGASYAAYNSDLVAAGLRDEARLRTHWATIGVHEGRRASATFHAPNYRRLNPDLASAFGDGWARYVEHYVAFGRHEGRAY